MDEVARTLLGRLALLVLCSAAPLAAADPASLIDAVQRGDRVAVSTLLDRGADVDDAQGDGMTALHWAARLDDLAMIELLLDAGASPRAATRFGVTALELAANNGSAAAVARLLRAGADPNA